VADLLEPGSEGLTAAGDLVEAAGQVGDEAGMSPSRLMCRIFTSWSLSITGKCTTTCRQEAGPASSRLPSGPSVPLNEVTSSSRIASRGGFVTCANSWLK